MPTDPLSTPDPWKLLQVHEDPETGCPMVQLDEVDAARTAERQQATAQQADHSRCHDLVCNGDRSQPRGTVGSSCSCKGRDTAYAEVASLTQRCQVQDADFAALSAEAQRFEERAKLYDAEHLLREAAEQQITALHHEIQRVVTGFRSQAMNGVICTPPLSQTDGLPRWDAPVSRTWCLECKQRWADLFSISSHLTGGPAT